MANKFEKVPNFLGEGEGGSLSKPNIPNRGRGGGRGSSQAGKLSQIMDFFVPKANLQHSSAFEDRLKILVLINNM